MFWSMTLQPDTESSLKICSMQPHNLKKPPIFDKIGGFSGRRTRGLPRNFITESSSKKFSFRILEVRPIQTEQVSMPVYPMLTVIPPVNLSKIRFRFVRSMVDETVGAKNRRYLPYWA